MSSQNYYGRSVTPLVESRTFVFSTEGDVYSACVTRGMNGARLGPWKTTTAAGSRRVKTAAGAGAVTDVVAVDQTSDVFRHIEEGDSISFIGPNGAAQRATVVVKVNDNNVQVEPHVELDITNVQPGYSPTGYEFQFRTLECTADPDVDEGWFPVKGWKAGNILLIVEDETSVTNGVDWRLQARKEGSASDTPVTIAEGTITQAAIQAGGPDNSLAIGAFEFDTYGWEELRLLIKADAGEFVYSAYFVGKQ